ncbi:hypothetical protein [Streptomyces sp. NPDC003077]|uniref:hypothetical protein n=1 Tax=Streptomyces sp. NPDC003077 TaxID=3154443 RepID=UPI0033B80F18
MHLRTLRRSGLAVGLALTATTALGGAATAAAPATAQPGRSTAQPVHYTARQVHGFLVGFYGHHGPSPYDRVHKVTPELRKKAAQTKDYDLLLCAQNTPRDISVGKVTTAQSAGVGWATITTHWKAGPDRKFTAYVGLDARKPMKLYDVQCPRRR